MTAAVADAGARVGHARLDQAPRLSIVVPVYKNEPNIAALLAALDGVAATVGRSGFEAVFVVDGSPDRSYPLLRDALPRLAYDAQLTSLSRNFGSFAAIRVGLERARGAVIGVMAADLQEPPQLMEQMLRELETGDVDIAFGQRADRDDGWLSELGSRVFWAAYRRFVVRDVPPGGVDVFACTREVAQTLLGLPEQNTSLVAQLFWVGFRRAFVPYARRRRVAGKSAWSFRRRLRYMLDSVFSFTDLPIQLVVWTGLVGVAASTAIATVTLTAKLMGAVEISGYTTVVLLVAFLGSMNLLIQGVIGLYTWRAFENTKRRPLAIVAHHVEHRVDAGPRS